MGKNLFFFTGDEKYLLRKKLEERKKPFFEKHGKENFFQFNSNDLDITELKNTILS
jgi:DNA polymerase III delta subunit